MSCTELEDWADEDFEKQKYIVFKRKNHCDVLAVKRAQKQRKKQITQNCWGLNPYSE